MYTFLEVLSRYVDTFSEVLSQYVHFMEMSSQYVHFHYCDSVHISSILDDIDHVFLTQSIIL